MSLKHALLALLVIVIWAINFVIIDAALDDVPPLVMVALRFGVIFLVAAWFVRPPKIGWGRILLISVFFNIDQFGLLYIALALGLPPGLASLLAQTQVIFSIVISIVVLRERPTRRQVVGVAVGMAGLAIVIAGTGLVSPLVPLVVVLASALSWAIGNVLIRKSEVRSGLSLVVWTSAAVPIPCLALSMIIDTPQVTIASFTHISPAVIFATLYSALIASLIGAAIWNGLLTRYPAAAVVPFTLLVPVLGMLTAFLVQGEQPTVPQLIGGAIMMAGLAGAAIRFGRRRRASEPEGATPDGGAPEIP